MSIDVLAMGGGGPAGPACGAAPDFDEWAAGQAIPVGSLRRADFTTSATADPRGLAEHDPTARFMRTDEALFSEDALHFISPEVGGCGILKLAGSVPESVILFAAPRSCARHGSVVGYRDGFRDRVFFLDLSEDELVMGVNADLIKEGVAEVLARLDRDPRAFFVCGTCVDDLLGTDLAGVCRELTHIYAARGIQFRDLHLPPICGRSSTPPPVRLQRSVYGLLTDAGPVPQGEREADAVNLIAGFARVDESSDMFAILRDMGYPTVRQMRACATYDEFLDMRRSALNLCLRPFGRPVCKEMERVLGIPFALVRSRLLPEHQAEEIERLAAMVGRPVDVSPYRAAAEQRLEDARPWLSGLSVSVGDEMSPFETACFLARLGAHVSFVLANRVSAQDWTYIEELQRIDPSVPVYPGGHPAFALAGRLPLDADVALGLDAGRLSGARSVIDPDGERGWLGFSHALNLLDELREAVERPLSPEEYYRRRSRVRRCDESGCVR